MNIQKIIEKLAKKRRCFCSEADFQHALAWKIHERNKDVEVRLEYPYQRKHVDIRIESMECEVVIELKYKTRKCEFEGIKLKNQESQDSARYDFIKDICRLEEIIAESDCAVGYAILLTNDPSYWKDWEKQESGKPVNDAEFRIHENNPLKGDLNWCKEAAKGTTEDREKGLSLKGRYECKWKDYSDCGKAKFAKFRYLLFKITSAGIRKA